MYKIESNETFVDLESTLTNELIDEYKTKREMIVKLNKNLPLFDDYYRKLYQIFKKVDFITIQLSCKFLFVKLNNYHYKIIKSIYLLTSETLVCLRLSEFIPDGVYNAIKFWKMFKNTKLKRLWFGTMSFLKEKNIETSTLNAIVVLRSLFCDISFSVKYTGMGWSGIAKRIKPYGFDIDFRNHKPKYNLRRIFFLYKFNSKNGLLMKLRNIMEREELSYLLSLIIKTKNKNYFDDSVSGLNSLYSVYNMRDDYATYLKSLIS